MGSERPVHLAAPERLVRVGEGGVRHGLVAAGELAARDASSLKVPGGPGRRRASASCTTSPGAAPRRRRDRPRPRLERASERGELRMSVEQVVRPRRGGARPARRRPTSAATVRTPAARPAARSCGESPTSTAPRARRPSRASASSTGSGCGFARAQLSAPIDRPHVRERARVWRSVRCAPSSIFAVTTAEGVTGRGERRHGLERAGEARVRSSCSQPVRAVAREQAVDVLRASGERRELRPERRADAGDPLGVGRAAAVALERVSHRGEDERDGVDEGAVEVEEDRDGSRAWPRRTG